MGVARMGVAAAAWLRPEAALGLQPLPDPVTGAVPLFFALLAVEVFAARWRRLQLYNLRQSISNVGAGVLTTLLGVFLRALHVFPYDWLWRSVGLVPQAARHAWWLNILTFLFVDLGFYTFHRAAHATNLGWSAHVVHHSSPDFNLSTALRQGAGEATVSWIFYLPLALVCPPEVYALHRGLNTVFQFFVHTQLVGKLWWPIEAVFNTPSHHRVHHTRNYGRRNFAGVLIVWDRMFGSFEPEQDGRPCLYGLDAQKVPLGSYSPLWHQAHHLAATLRLVASGKAPLWRALLTRQWGPGMVAPSTTDAEPAGRGAAVTDAVQRSRTGAEPAAADCVQSCTTTDAEPAGHGAVLTDVVQRSRRGAEPAAADCAQPSTTTDAGPAGRGAVLTDAVQHSRAGAEPAAEGGVQPSTTTDAEPAGRGAGAVGGAQSAAAGNAGGGGSSSGEDAKPGLSRGNAGGGKQQSPWESRPRSLLDYYAAFHFFMVTLPAAFAFLLLARNLSPGWVALGAGAAAWSVITLGALCGGQRSAVQHELVRLGSATLGALCLLLRGGLPPLGAAAVWAAVAASAASSVLLARNMPGRVKSSKAA